MFLLTLLPFSSVTAQDGTSSSSTSSLAQDIDLLVRVDDKTAAELETILIDHGIPENQIADILEIQRQVQQNELAAKTEPSPKRVPVDEKCNDGGLSTHTQSAFALSSVQIQQRTKRFNLYRLMSPALQFGSPVLSWPLACLNGANAHFSTGIGSVLSQFTYGAALKLDQVDYCMDYDGTCNYVHIARLQGQVFTKHEVFGGGLFPAYEWPWVYCVI